MSKAQAQKTREAAAGTKRKLSRAEQKQIAALIRQAKGDGKAHTAQQTIPYLQMYPDGICRITEKKYSKSIVFEDIILSVLRIRLEDFNITFHQFHCIYGISVLGKIVRISTGARADLKDAHTGLQILLDIMDRSQKLDHTTLGSQTCVFIVCSVIVRECFHSFHDFTSKKI